MLGENKCGIGFGVGHEPLPAIFAARQCRILATEKADNSDGRWLLQWPDSREALVYPEICRDHLFSSNVEFQHVDMNQISDGISGYDFAWSCSSLEHLGSLQHSVTFLLRQMNCLKPGGWAVHTTEFNLFSDQNTITYGNTVLFRKKDIAELETELKLHGHHLESVDFMLGDQMEDWFVAHEPYADTTKNLAHLRILVGRYLCTSMLLIIRKGM